MQGSIGVTAGQQTAGCQGVNSGRRSHTALLYPPCDSAMMNALMRMLLLPMALAMFTLAVACADDGGEIPQTGTPAESSSSGGTPTVTPVLTSAVPTTSPVNTESWVTYDGYFGDATFQYPASWKHVPGGGIYSWDPDAAADVYIPVDGIKLEPSALPVGEVTRPASATDYTFGENAGWELIEEFEPEFGPGYAHTVAVDYGGLLYTITAYFGPDVEGEVLFSQILETLRFAE